MTSLVMRLASRVFCSSDVPGHSFTITWGILVYSYPARETSPAVLLVGDVLHPLDRRAVQLLLDGDVAHGRRRRGAVPVLLARLGPDHVARPDLLDRPALALD